MSAKIDNVLILAADLARTVAFYEALGFARSKGGGAMALLSDGETRLTAITRDASKTLIGDTAAAAGSPRVLLGRQARSNQEVDEMCQAAEKAGAQIVRKPGPNDWGGYSGAFADPDGNVWNVGFNMAFYKKA